MTDSEAELDFNKADFGDKSAGLTCANCSSGITDRYFEVNDQVMCPRCRGTLDVLTRAEGKGGRIVRATVFGTLGGALGAAVWYAVAALFKLEIGLIAILVGWLVGNGVRRGSGGRGGRGYQILAAFIAYASIVTTYIPDILEGLGRTSGVFAIFASYAIAFAAPFLGGLENAIGILIIFFAVQQAWSLNKKPVLEVRGPFQTPHGAAASDLATS